MSLQESKQKLTQIAQKGQADEAELPLLRGWLKFLPDGQPDTLQLAFAALKLLAKTDDPRDLMLLFWQGLKKVPDRAAAQQAYQQAELDEPLRSMIGRLLHVKPDSQ